MIALFERSREHNAFHSVVSFNYIVVASRSEPSPGWIDSMLGPTGIAMGIMCGAVRTLPFDLLAPANVVPVDMCANAVLACAWAVSTQQRRDPNAADDPPIYNFFVSPRNPLSWRQMFAYVVKYARLYPPAKALWCAAFTENPQRWWHAAYRWTLHTVPAALVDAVAWMCGRAGGMRRMYGRIDRGVAVLKDSWRIGHWVFGTERLMELRMEMLTARDRELFDFGIDAIDWDAYMRDYVLGMRRFMLKDLLATVEAARRRCWWFEWLNWAMKVVAAVGIGWGCYAGIERLWGQRGCRI